MSILQRPLSSGGYLARNGSRLADRHAAQAFHLPFAIALVAYGIAYVAWAAIRPFGSNDIRFIAVLDIAGALPPFLAAAMAFLAHRFSSGRTSRGWLLLALGWASWGVGEATWTVYEVVRRTDAPFPSLADVGYLAMVPLVLAGILTLTPGHPKSHRLTNLFNAASTTLLAAALTWYFVLGDIFGQTDRRPEAFLSAAYPIGDLLLLTALALAFQRIWRGRAGIVLAVLFGGVVFFLVADIGFAYLDINNEYESGNLITDPAWVISFLLMAYAAALHIAWQPNYRVLLDAGRRALWFQFLPVGYPVVLAIFLVAYAMGFQSPVGGNSAMISFAAIASLTMLGRVMLVLVGNVRIVHETNRELSRAAKMQSVLLPPRLHEGPHYDIAAHYLPARNLGGDFYDWWEDPPGTLHIALGDVMGKGMSAALLMHPCGARSGQARRDIQ